jgi:hypothetical protein
MLEYRELIPLLNAELGEEPCCPHQMEFYVGSKNFYLYLLHFFEYGPFYGLSAYFLQS